MTKALALAIIRDPATYGEDRVRETAVWLLSSPETTTADVAEARAALDTLPDRLQRRNRG